MALCAGALRRWLVEAGELPDGPTRALVPVAVRSAREAAQESGQAGNQVAAMIADLPTHLEDPLERFRAVGATMRKAKEEFAMLPAELLQDFSEFTAPAASELIARTAASLRLADTVAPTFNLTISNVPGPRDPLYLAGALMESNFPIPMIGDGVALSMTVHGCRDRLDFVLTSCLDAIANLADLFAYLADEVEVLRRL